MAILNTRNGLLKLPKTDIPVKVAAIKRTVTIVITPDDKKCRINLSKTGIVSNIEISDFLNAITKHYSLLVTNEYIAATGDKAVDTNKLDNYLKSQRTKTK